MALTMASYHTLRLHIPLVLLGTLPFFWRVYLQFRPKILAIALAIGGYVALPAI